MKIALVLRGHYRTFDTTSVQWRRALTGISYDCYFHTWNIKDSTLPTVYRKGTYSIELNEKQINTLKSFDPNLVIETQEFTESDISNLYLSTPHKSFIYRYDSLRDTLQRIPQDTYDIVIVGRYDLLIKSLENLEVSEDEIVIGGTYDNKYHKGIRGNDMIFAFHPKNIPLFTTNPYLETMDFKYGEEPFSDFIYNKFKKVSVKWKYEKDFIIKR